MKRRMRGIAVLATVLVVAAGIELGAGIGRAQEGPDDFARKLASLIEAEKAFSKTSEDRGIREAFLAWLAPDAVVFRPSPVPGRPVYEKMDPANPAVLTWEPEFAEIAVSGELGFTTGPYQFRPRRDAEPAGFGHYVSVWKKQPDGSWKVFLDIGVEHGPVSLSKGNIQLGVYRMGVQPLSPERLREEELAFGRRAGAFEKAAGTKGLRKALEGFATNDIRIYRPGQPPAVGKAALASLVPDGSGRILPGSGTGRSAYQVIMGWSGDLAATYGTFEVSQGSSAAESRSYLRIWRKRDTKDWMICLDIEIPVPDKEPTG